MESEIQRYRDTETEKLKPGHRETEKGTYGK